MHENPLISIAFLSADDPLRACIGYGPFEMMMMLLMSLLVACGGPVSRRQSIAIVPLGQAGLHHPRRDSILAAQNREGAYANDFTYYDPEGNPHTLYGIEAPYTLLYIHNPECRACKEMKAALAASPVVAEAVASGRLYVLALYIDRDTALWKRHLPEMPDSWHNGRDEEEFLYLHDVYDVRAIPTLYLLDEDKKVLLRDVRDVRKLEEMIHLCTKIH